MTNDKDLNVLSFPDPDKTQAALESLKRAQDFFTEAHSIMAKIRRGAYEAYIAEKFTPEQALILCQKMTL